MRQYPPINTTPRGPPLSKATVTLPSHCSTYTEHRVFCMLDQIKYSSPGLDNLPHCFLQFAVPSLALLLSHLFNLSLQQSIVPNFPHNGNAAILLTPALITGASRLPLFLPDLWKNQSSRTTCIPPSCILTTAICFKISPLISQRLLTV